MRIEIIAAGTRMPEWVDQGFHDYARRIKGDCNLKLKEIPLAPRGKSGGGPKRAKEEEGKRLLAAASKACYLVCLDQTGKSLNTTDLAAKFIDWKRSGRDLALLIGGPDGLDPRCFEACDFTWSLSPLTLPHGLVRVVLAESLYRAWSLGHNHPYHRA